MKQRTSQADLLDQFLEALVRDPAAVAPKEVDEETASVARAVVLAQQVDPPSQLVQDRVWRRVLVAARTEAAAPSRGRWARPFAGLRVAHVLGAAAALLLVLGAALWLSPGVRAYMERLLCFLPGLGIRACEPTALVSPSPVSTSRDGATLVVKNLLATGSETTMQVEITGLPQTPSFPPTQVRLVLRDELGKTYPPAPGRLWMSGGGTFTAPGGSQTFHAEARFVALDPNVRAVELLVDGPPPVGTWHVRVPLTPVQQAGLPKAQEAESSASLHGITVRVASVLADRERTVVQLVATAEPPFRFVRGVGGFHLERQLVLHDDQGREYGEVSAPSRTFPDEGGVHTDDVPFPPLAADARTAELVVPFVVVSEQTDEASLTVPIAGRGVGESIPLNTSLRLGRYSLVARDAAIIEQRGQRMLALRLDLGDRHEGRRLVGLERLWVAGRDTGYQFGPTDAASRLKELRVEFPDAPRDQVTVVFRDAQVAVEGPWRLQVPVPATR